MATTEQLSQEVLNVPIIWIALTKAVSNYIICCLDLRILQICKSNA